MTFGYVYLMADGCATSFLRFVHNSAGATNSRNYSGGRECQLRTFVSVAELLRKTVVGTTRFDCDPHRTHGPGIAHWTHITKALNQRLGNAIDAGLQPVHTAGGLCARKP
jgi:hypothetical protein